MGQFLIVLSFIFAVFIFLIYWFMAHEETKAFNFHAKRAAKLKKQLETCESVLKNTVNHLRKLEKQIEKLKSANSICHTRIKNKEINYTDDIDMIAEELGTRVTRKAWIEKTNAGKMAAILKKIEKLK